MLEGKIHTVLKYGVPLPLLAVHTELVSLSHGGKRNTSCPSNCIREDISKLQSFLPAISTKPAVLPQY